MNATAPSDSIEVISVTDYHNESDSDTNIDEDEEAAGEFYQPVSAVDSEDEDDAVWIHSHHHHQLSNGAVTVNQVQNGIAALHLNGDVHHNIVSEDDEEEEEVVEVVSESEIMRAFREDENRRRAPLTAENAMRVREAMRGISFAGAPPPWAGRVPEDNWMDRLRGLGSSTRR